MTDVPDPEEAVLRFDEAEGLLGHRTSAKDAHDRYANIEVDDLLARAEHQAQRSETIRPIRPVPRLPE